MSPLLLTEEMAKEPAPIGGEKLTPLTGVGASGTLGTDTIEPEPKVIYHVAKVYFLKGSVAGTLTVWQKAAPASEIARAAAKQVVAKLPYPYGAMLVRYCAFAPSSRERTPATRAWFF